MRAVGRTAWLLVAAVIGMPAQPALAQQALNISLGYFTVTGEDARTDGDVLVANRDILAFDVDDFNSGSVGLEWLFPVGEFLEVGAGAAFTTNTVHSVYKDFVNIDDSEIQQDLKLRMAPFTATLRFLPFGRSRPVQPYLGGGVGFLVYRYSEVGDFVDFTDDSIDYGVFEASGTEVGAVALAGIRFPISDNWSLGGEVRYQQADADLSLEFLGDKLDLGGFHYLATVHVKF
jgi:opacity protein-like surface antigen